MMCACYTKNEGTTKLVVGSNPPDAPMAANMMMYRMMISAEMMSPAMLTQKPAVARAVGVPCRRAWFRPMMQRINPGIHRSGPAMKQPTIAQMNPAITVPGVPGVGAP